MGAFGVLGHAAGGFEQAHQQDLQRQFIDEQARRQSALDVFKGLAFDPNQPEDVRRLALNQYGTVINTPYGKFNDKKVFEPMQQAMADFQRRKLLGQQFQQQNQGPPVMQGGGQLNLPTMTHSFNYQPQLPPGTAGPPPPPQSFQTQVPAMQATGPKPQITPGALPPLPPELADTARSGYFAGIPELAQSTAALSGAQAGGTLGGELGVKKEFAQQLLSDPRYQDFINENPMLRSMLVSAQAGITVPFGAMFRNIGPKGGGYAGDLRAQGANIDKSIPDDQWVNVQNNVSGMQYVPGAAPGAREITPGKLGGVSEQTTARQEAMMPFWKQKFGMQAALRMQMQDRAFHYALTQHDYTRLDQIYADQFKDYAQRDQSLGLMQKLRDQAMSGKGPANQQAMVALLGQHIGMTTPVGGRVSRASYEEAEQSASKVGLGIAKFFHYDKDTDQYVFDGWKGGINLTPDQMNNMVQLAKDRVDTSRDTLGYYKNAMQEGGYAPPALGAMGGGPPSAGGGKPRGGGPPKQNASGAGSPPQQSSSHQSFADWKKSQKGAVK